MQQHLDRIHPDRQVLVFDALQVGVCHLLLWHDLSVFAPFILILLSFLQIETLSNAGCQQFRTEILADQIKDDDERALEASDIAHEVQDLRRRPLTYRFGWVLYKLDLHPDIFREVVDQVQIVKLWDFEGFGGEINELDLLEEQRVAVGSVLINIGSVDWFAILEDGFSEERHSGLP